MTPTSPITPNRRLAVDDQHHAPDIERYEQDNYLGEQESLLEVGKYGLHLIEDLKSKNLLVEQLSNRLRMIYSCPSLATPDHFCGSVHSFLSSIPGPSGGSSRTVSPSIFPQGVFGECLEKAEKEIARLDELVLAQGRQIDALKYDLSEADLEREKSKQDRIKLKKEIMELQVLLKRKDNSETLLREKDRLMTSASIHNSAAQTCAVVQTRNQTVQTSFGDDEKIALLEQLIKDERIIFSTEIEKLIKKNQPRSNISVGTSPASFPVFSVGSGTDPVTLKHASLGPDCMPTRFSSEWAQCNIIDSASESLIKELSEENGKLREKYLKYRSEIAKRRQPVFSVASGSDEKSFIDRQTATVFSTTSTIDSIVQVDDPRDERLFILEADLRFAAEERDALVAQIEEIESEKDLAIEELETIRSAASDSDSYIRHLTSEINRLQQQEEKKLPEPPKLVMLSSSLMTAAVKTNDTFTETIVRQLEDKNIRTDEKVSFDCAVGTVYNQNNFPCQSVQADDRSQLETIKSLSEELWAMRNKPPSLDSAANTEAKSFSDAQSGPASSCFSLESAGVGPDEDMSPTSDYLLHKLITSESSTQVADKQLENEVIISLQKKLIRKEKMLRASNDLIALGLSEKSRSATVQSHNAAVNTHPSPARDNSFDISAIVKPVSSTTASNITACSPPQNIGGTFDFSISSLQNQLLSSLSPKRIPFSTPDQLPKDPDGDVVMQTAPRTQIRNIPLGVGFVVHEDPGEDSDKLQENIDLKKSLKTIREKAFIAHSLSERIGALTSLVDKNRT